MGAPTSPGGTATCCRLERIQRSAARKGDEVPVLLPRCGVWLRPVKARGKEAPGRSLNGRPLSPLVLACCRSALNGVCCDELECVGAHLRCGAVAAKARKILGLHVLGEVACYGRGEHGREAARALSLGFVHLPRASSRLLVAVKTGAAWRQK